MTAKPWAILLVNFPADRSQPHTKEWYERFFTKAGAGTGGMFDFWTDMSYGKAVLADSAVYGWFELTDDYTGSGGRTRQVATSCSLTPRQPRVRPASTWTTSTPLLS